MKQFPGHRRLPYDNLYHLTSEAIASDPDAINGAVSYTYDAVGNRKQMSSSLAPIPAGFFNYDANERARGHSGTRILDR